MEPQTAQPRRSLRPGHAHDPVQGRDHGQVREAPACPGNYILGEEVRLLEEETGRRLRRGRRRGRGLRLERPCSWPWPWPASGPGDEVITTPYTFDATMEAIILLDAVPVFVDIQPDGPEHRPGRDRGRHHAARPGPSCRCTSSARRATWTPSRRSPTSTTWRWSWTWPRPSAPSTTASPAARFGRMSTLSFYPTKNLPGIGDGGMVFCRDQRGRRPHPPIRGHQAVRINDHLYTGWNSRLDEIQAMVIRVRQARFADEQARPRPGGRHLRQLHPGGQPRCRLPNGGSGMKVTYHQYWVRCPDRDGLRDRAGRQRHRHGDLLRSAACTTTSWRSTVAPAASWPRPNAPAARS